MKGCHKKQSLLGVCYYCTIYLGKVYLLYFVYAYTCTACAKPPSLVSAVLCLPSTIEPCRWNGRHSLPQDRPMLLAVPQLDDLPITFGNRYSRFLIDCIFYALLASRGGFCRYVPPHFFSMGGTVCPRTVPCYLRCLNWTTCP